MTRSRRFPFAAAGLAALFALSADMAEAGPLSGTWRQTGSNAGVCPTCSVSIREDGSLAALTANNGWSANLSWQDPKGTQAIGRGRWKRSVGGTFGGKEIDVGVKVSGDTLTLTMSVSDGSVPGQIVAKYSRVGGQAVLFGNPAPGADAPVDSAADQIHNGVRRYTCPEGLPLIATFSEDAAIADISIDGSPKTRLQETAQGVYSNKHYTLTVRGRIATVRSPTGTDKCRQN